MKLKPSDRKVLENAFDMGSGYLLDFSDKTMSEFFDEQFEILVYDAKYDFDYQSKSKANRLRGIFQSVDELTAGKIILELVNYKEGYNRDLSENELRLIEKAKQTGIKLIEGSYTKDTEGSAYFNNIQSPGARDRQIFKNINHECKENVYTDRVLRALSNVIYERFDEEEILQVLADLDIDPEDFNYHSGPNNSLLVFLTEIKKGTVRLNELLDERHISKIVESFLDPILWESDAYHEIFYKKIERILSKTDLSLAKEKNKHVYIFDEDGYFSWKANLQYQDYYERDYSHQNQEVVQAAIQKEKQDYEISSLKGKEEEIKNLMEWHQHYMDVLEIFCKDIRKPTVDLNKSFLYLRDVLRSGVANLNVHQLITAPYAPFTGDLFSAEKQWNLENADVLTWDVLRPELNHFHGRLSYLYQHSRTNTGSQDVSVVLPQIMTIIEKHRSDVQSQSKASIAEHYITKEGDTFLYSGDDMELNPTYGYVRAFIVLFDLVGPDEGFCSYENFEKAFKKKYPKVYRAQQDGFKKWAQKQLTERDKNILKRTHPELIKTREGKGFEFRNKKR